MQAGQHGREPQDRAALDASFVQDEISCRRSPHTIGLLRSLASPNAKDAMRFDLADLSLFRHVVEAGSITHGAGRANLALAAASTRIRNMEEALGAPLLVRGRQGVSPTPAGRTLQKRGAQRLLHVADAGRGRG